MRVKFEFIAAVLFLTFFFGAGAAAKSGTSIGLGAFGPTQLDNFAIPSSTLTVTKTADTNDGACDADCSLREAIAAAAPGDTIEFASPLFDSTQTITLGLGDLQINKNLTINGTGAKLLTVSGNNASRVFFVGSGANVTIGGLTVTQGNGSGASPNTCGGGILVSSATLTLNSSVLTGNSVPFGGACNDGSGLYNRLGTVNIVNSTINNNSGAAGISTNTGTTNIINSTISNNSGRFAGGIGSFQGANNLTNVTVSGNTATNGPGGIQVNGSAFYVRNSIIANSVGADCAVNFSLNIQHSLVEDGSCGVTNGVNNNRTGDPALGALADNGGPTPTHALLANSPAINAGNNCVTDLSCSSNNPPFALTTDQRGAGFARKVGSAVDLGAFEAPASLVVTNTNDSGAGSLRAAIAAANSDPAYDAITFDIPPTAAGCVNGVCTITLTSGELLIAGGGSLLINGTGANKLHVSGNNQSRVIHVAGGSNLYLSGLTIKDGNGGSQGGGGIISLGASLTILNSAVTGSSAGTGGGIYAVNSPLNLISSTVSGNTTNSDFSIAGGIYYSANSGHHILTVTNSTISGNTSTSLGAGILAANGSGNISLFMTNSTVSDNRINGSGIGGGIYFQGNQGVVRNTIISGNFASSNPDLFGNLSVNENNLIGDFAGVKLSPLGFYGGTTLTHALLSGSTAINAGTSTNAPATDQRGAPRVGNVDIGAFELNNSANGGNFRAQLPAGRQFVLYNYTIIPNIGLYDSLGLNGSFPFSVFVNQTNALVAQGTPSQTGTFNFSATVSYGANSFVTDYTLEILPPLDSTPPVITPNVTGTLGNDGWYVSDVQVSWSVTDGESTVSNQTGCATQNVTADTSGVTFTCSAQSAGGSNSQSVTVKRDATAPTISFFARTTPNSNGWNNTNVAVEWTCADSLSGAVSSSVTTIVSTEGANQTALGICTDNAGNTAQNTQSGIKIDKTAPAITLDSRTAPNAAGWNNSNVALVWACADTLSGAVNPTAGQTIGTEGANQTATGTCSDLAGNSSSDTQSGINIDKTAPVITFDSRTPAANAAGWNNTSVSVNWTCSDVLSGAVNPAVSQTVSGEGANQSATGTCTDAAGNSAQNTQTGIKIDKTAPTITFNSRTAPNAAGWNNTNVQVNWTCADALSGAASAGVNQLLTAEGIGQTAIGTCTDLAGNSSSNTQSGIKIDKTPPALNPTVTPNPVQLNGAASASANASDALAGISSALCPTVVTTSVGFKSVLCTALDQAGNTASANANYQVVYNFSGFFAPIQNLPATNAVAAGQVIDITFSLAGNQGLNVIASGYPASVQIPCSASEPGGGLQPTVGFGRNAFSYNSATNRYRYQWQTSTSWAGTCRMFVLKLADGSEHFAKFQFQ